MSERAERMPIEMVHQVIKIWKKLIIIVEILSWFLYNKNISSIERKVELQAGGNYGRTI